jgi:lipopolysaccharide transport system ATP-binding protein
MLNGLIKPDRGTITMRGRVGALIALGAGFNPILTGRENSYINGSVLGLTKKEIDAKIDEIIDFAEIREFIDTPVQNYSSGMAVRLGFAVATTLEPDILILDEVLAVGDAAFRAKCYKRIGELQDRAAVIFVSHSMEQMARIANSGIVLDRGKVRILGSIEQAIKLYEETETQQSNKNNGFLRYSEEISNCHISIDNCIIKWGGEINIKISFNCSEDRRNNRKRSNI